MLIFVLLVVIAVAWWKTMVYAMALGIWGAMGNDPRASRPPEFWKMNACGLVIALCSIALAMA